MSLKPYQTALELNSAKIDSSYAELAMFKKRVITAYFTEMEARMWALFAGEQWTKDQDKDSARAREIVIELSKEMNIEWNEHHNQNDHLPHNGFIELASKIYDFPIKIVPIMR